MDFNFNKINKQLNKYDKTLVEVYVRLPSWSLENIMNSLPPKCPPLLMISKKKHHWYRGMTFQGAFL